MALRDPSQAELLKKKKRLKYGNHKVVVRGEKFDSKKEARRWEELKIMYDAGMISGLYRQLVWHLEVNGILICKYVCDFSYTRDGEAVVEDVKSPSTRKNPSYRLKRKLMFALHGIRIKES